MAATRWPACSVMAMLSFYEILQEYAPLFIIAMILLVLKNMFVADQVKGDQEFKQNYKNLALLSMAALFIGAYNAAFVIGDWIIALLILTSIFSLKYHQAIFLLVFSMFFSQPIAAYQYYLNGLIDFRFLIPMFSATLLGGLISAIILDKIHSQKLETLLKYLSLALVIYLIAGFFT